MKLSINVVTILIIVLGLVVVIASAHAFESTQTECERAGGRYVQTRPTVVTPLIFTGKVAVPFRQEVPTFECLQEEP